MKRFWVELISREAIRIIKNERLGQVLRKRGKISLIDVEIKKLKSRLIQIPLIELLEKDKKAIVPMGHLKGEEATNTIGSSKLNYPFYFLFIKNGEFEIYMHPQIPEKVSKIIDPLFLRNRTDKEALIYWISDLQKKPMQVKKDIEELFEEVPSFKEIKSLC